MDVLAVPPQGTVASRLLANIYLHDAFDLWVQRLGRHGANGDVIVVRYADDSVARFERKADAHRFLDAYKERLAEFGLALNEEKTRVVGFGRFAIQHSAQRGLRGPQVLICEGAGSGEQSSFLPQPLAWREQPVSYDFASVGGVATTWPSFTGSVAPGLKVVRTTPSLPSRRYVTL